jgi:hypothetical protein
LSDIESLLLGLEEELRAAALLAVQGVVARTRQEVQRVLQAALWERDAGVKEVARLRAELAQEVAAVQKIQAVHRSRVVLDIGGVRHVTSVATLRRAQSWTPCLVVHFTPVVGPSVVLQHLL